MDAARRLGSNLLRLARTGARRGLRRAPGAAWLVLRLGPLTSDEPELPPWLRLTSPGAARQLRLLDALRVLAAAADDDGLAGVLLRFHGPLPGWSKAAALRRAVDRLRGRGVPVVAWAERLGPVEYHVASGAERVWLPASGALWLVGLRSDRFYLKGALEKLDIRPEVVRIGDYKSAAESFTHAGMSPEEREQAEAWLDDVHGLWVAGMATGRGLSPEAVLAEIDRAPHPARAACEAGLADGCLELEELDPELEKRAREPAADRAGPRHPRRVEADTYLDLVVDDPGWLPLRRGLPEIAYVVAEGTLHAGESSRGIACDAYRALFEELAQAREVRGVTLRIDSPGGDATTSDRLHRAVERLTREKPVVVSMGDVAASGGYDLAAAADRIFAEAPTLTGSIGVVGGKLDLSGLYQRLGIGRESLERGARAGLMAEDRGFTPDERQAVRREMESIYQLFLERVAAGRGLSLSQLRPLAGGRVWSGRRAVELGLADREGGPLEALAETQRLAGVSLDERQLLTLHPRRPVWRWR